MGQNICIMVITRANHAQIAANGMSSSEENTQRIAVSAWLQRKMSHVSQSPHVYT